MHDLPLFPLNTVVFPGMPMPLHIFEERYKAMINDCIDNDAPFGIVLIREGEAEYDENAQPYEVGCTVTISQVERLPDGRMFLMAIGQDRFQIHALDRESKPYLMGTVETLAYETEELDALQEEVTHLHGRVLEYLKILSDLGKVEFETDNVPREPEALACMAASLLNVSNEKKQTLLTINKVSKLVQYLSPIYDQEVRLLRMMPREDESVFSVN